MGGTPDSTRGGGTPDTRKASSSTGSGTPMGENGGKVGGGDGGGRYTVKSLNLDDGDGGVKTKRRASREPFAKIRCEKTLDPRP